MSMDTVRVAYRDDDRTPVIYCIKEMGAKHYGINVEVLKIKDYGEFEASLFNDSADVLIDHVEFLYAEATKGKKITFFCAPRIVRGLDLMVPKHVENVSEFTRQEYGGQGFGPALYCYALAEDDGIRGQSGSSHLQGCGRGTVGAVEESRKRRMHRLLYGSPCIRQSH